MIKSFADTKTQQIFAGIMVKKMPQDLQKQALKRLIYLDKARSIEDLRVPPSNKLEKKEGNLKEFYAIWVNRQYRIIFKWKDGHAYEVALTDYH
jgi:proteic killer suppression protein